MRASPPCSDIQCELTIVFQKMVSSGKRVARSQESIQNKKKKVAAAPNANKTTPKVTSGKKREHDLRKRSVRKEDSRRLPASSDAVVLPQKATGPENEANGQAACLVPPPQPEAEMLPNEANDKTPGASDLLNESANLAKGIEMQITPVESLVDVQEGEKERSDKLCLEVNTEPQKTSEVLEKPPNENAKLVANTEKQAGLENVSIVASSADSSQTLNSTSDRLLQDIQGLFSSEKEITENRKNANDILKAIYTKEDDVLDQVLPREVVEAEKGLKPNKRPEYPPGMALLIKREIAFFQRKIRAYRKVKNHLLTADLKLLEREAEAKNWGKVPEFVKQGQSKASNVLVETCFALWPKPFIYVEKQWWLRHLSEFAKEWAIPQSAVMTSNDLTPYMKYVRAFPPSELLAVMPDLAQIQLENPPKFPFVMTNTNFILDAKSMLTYYGVHKLHDWEVKENIDYDVVDFWVLLEDVNQAGKALADRVLRYRKAMKMCDEPDEG